MGKQIIQQPDGLFAIFSTNTDTIHMYDASAEEIEQSAHVVPAGTGSAMTRLAELRLLAEAVRRARPDYDDPPEVVAERDEERSGWIHLQSQSAALQQAQSTP